MAPSSSSSSKTENIKTRVSASSPRQASLSSFLAPTKKKPHSGKVQTTLFGTASSKTKKDTPGTKQPQADDEEDNDDKDVTGETDASGGGTKRKKKDDDAHVGKSKRNEDTTRPKRSKPFANQRSQKDDQKDRPGPATVSPDSTSSSAASSAAASRRNKKRLCIVESDEEEEEETARMEENGNDKDDQDEIHGKDHGDEEEEEEEEEESKTRTPRTKRLKTTLDKEKTQTAENPDDDDDEDATVTKEILHRKNHDNENDNDLLDSPQKPKRVRGRQGATRVNKGKSKQETTPPPPPTTRAKRARTGTSKETSTRNDDDDVSDGGDDDVMDGNNNDDDEEESTHKGKTSSSLPEKPAAAKAAPRGAASKRAARAFQDEDDDDDDDDDDKEEGDDEGDDDDDDDDDDSMAGDDDSMVGLEEQKDKENDNDTPQKANKKAEKKKKKKKSSGKKTGSTAVAVVSNHPTDEDLRCAAAWLRQEESKDKWGTVPYAALCETLLEIEGVTSRLQIQDLLTCLLRQALLVPPEKCRQQLQTLLYLASNSVAPAYQCLELGVGDSILLKAIGEASGTQTNILKSRYEVDGDLGTVAQNAKGKQRTLQGFGVKPKPLGAHEVLTVFRQIAQTSGSQSQKYKVDKIKGLLVRAQGSEAKFIIRGLQGKLRIGLAQSTVLISLAHALVLTPPGETTRRNASPQKSSSSLDERLEAAVAIIKQAYSEVPSYDALVEAALSVPLEEISKECSLRPGIPVSPMLAKPTKSVQEVLKRLNGQRFTCEYKYDGERAQIHKMPDGTTKVFSRNLLDTTEKYPEAPLYALESSCESEVSSFVLDAEVVAWNRETQKLVPFQVLSTRRKKAEEEEEASVQIIVQAFDLMYLNGTSLLNQTLAERRQLLKQHFKPVEGKFQFATWMDHTENGDTTVIEEFLDAAVKGQCEGLMVKTLEDHSAYEPSRRSLHWLKLKKDYLEGLGDSVDLVPLGAYHGKGKRTGVYGAYLLACRNAETEEFQSVCKIGTGFSDEDLVSLSQSLTPHTLDTKSPQYSVSEALACDVWFAAVQVWEVKAADLSLSSVHRGAVGQAAADGERGIGLRFPRFVRVRTDKRTEQATTANDIWEMYHAQETVAGAGASAMDHDGI